MGHDSPCGPKSGYGIKLNKIFNLSNQFPENWKKLLFTKQALDENCSKRQWLKRCHIDVGLDWNRKRKAWYNGDTIILDNDI